MNLETEYLLVFMLTNNFPIYAQCQITTTDPNIVTISYYIWVGCGDLTLCVYWKVICQHEKPRNIPSPDSSNKRQFVMFMRPFGRLFDESEDGIFMAFHVDK